ADDVFGAGVVHLQDGDNVAQRLPDLGDEIAGELLVLVPADHAAGQYQASTGTDAIGIAFRLLPVRRIKQLHCDFLRRSYSHLYLSGIRSTGGPGWKQPRLSRIRTRCSSSLSMLQSKVSDSLLRSSRVRTKLSVSPSREGRRKRMSAATGSSAAALA